LAGIRQFSATVIGGRLSVKEPVAGTGLGIAGKRQVSGGQVADICPSHTQLAWSQPAFRRSSHVPALCQPIFSTGGMFYKR